MSQTWTDDCYDGAHVGQTDLQNMENNFACLKSCFSGASAPSSPVAGMFWLDTTNHILKIRNEANNAWLSIMDMATGLSVAVNGYKSGGVTLTTGSGLSGGGDLSADRTLAVSGVTLSQLAAYAAGNNVFYYREVNAGVTSTSYVKKAEILLPKGGTLRIRMGLSYLLSDTYIYGRIYRDGTAVGTIQSKKGGEEAFTEDIAGWSAGNRLQVYARLGTSGCTGLVTTLELMGAAFDFAPQTIL